MIQSSRSGKMKMVTPLEIDSMWTQDELKDYLARFKSIVPAPTGKLCKPQNYEVIKDAVSKSEDLYQRQMTDIAERLMAQLGPHVVKSIYYGFLVGKDKDLESMVRTPNPETVKFEGQIVPAVHLLAAHFIANAMLECISKVANQVMRSAVRTQLRRFVAASGGVLQNYCVAINNCLAHKDQAYMFCGYELPGYVVYYVHPEKYEDMVMWIQPSPLMESERAEMAIRNLTSKLSLNSAKPSTPSDRRPMTGHRPTHDKHAA